MEVVTYTIICARNASDLTNEVRSAIKLGWKPQGGVNHVIVPASTLEYWSQAMIKES